MVDSRQRILEYLKRFGEASVSELSRSLSLTAVTIRHHLEALRSEKLVGQPVARRKAGPGRPEMVYRLTGFADQHMPRNYGELCACLLDAIKTAPDLAPLPSVLQQAGEEIGRQAISPAADRSRPRTNAIRAFLEDRGYFPSLTKDAQGFTLTLANCPYLEAATHTPALCLLDLGLVRALFGQPVQMAGRIVQGLPVCTFSIQDSGGIDRAVED